MKLLLNKDYIKSKSEEFFNNKKPICFICKKEVDKIEYMQCLQTMNIIIKAYCHGDVDTRSTEIEFFNQYGFNNIKQGIAFDIRRI